MMCIYIDIGWKCEFVWMDGYIYEREKTRQNRGTASFSTWILIFIHYVVPCLLRKYTCIAHIFIHPHPHCKLGS